MGGGETVVNFWEREKEGCEQVGQGTKRRERKGGELL